MLQDLLDENMGLGVGGTTFKNDLNVSWKDPLSNSSCIMYIVC